MPKGMAQIIVARMEKNQYLVSSILVDYWCLGVKNALFKKCDRAKYELLLTGTARFWGRFAGSLVGAGAGDRLWGS
jgi:hypothetical protein